MNVDVDVSAIGKHFLTPVETTQGQHERILQLIVWCVRNVCMKKKKKCETRVMDYKKKDRTKAKSKMS